MKTVFTPDISCKHSPILIPGELIQDPAAILPMEVSEEARRRGDAFADEIEEKFIGDFERTEEMAKAIGLPNGDKMVHVSTFVHIGNTIYMTYYANTHSDKEDPNFQVARLAFCPDDNPKNLTILDIQAVGDLCGGKTITLVYDTILAQVDDDTLMILWAAQADDNYYRLCRTFTLSTHTLGDVVVNRFRVRSQVNDFSTTGITTALTWNGYGIKKMFSDIGIMQKFTSRMEDGQKWYYTGAYSGDFTCIIKSTDFITWEYVSQPDFPNLSEWENACYILGDKCYYAVRQYTDTPYCFLTAYDLVKHTWERPVLIPDSQSRCDFIFYQGNLYLFHAPIDREHIGIVRVDTEDLSKSKRILEAKMHSSCFYPFIQYYDDGELAMSYTVNRQHIRLARFTLSKYI